MKITLKQGLVITLIFGLVVVGFSLVGNNQRVNADGSVTRLSISEIKDLFGFFFGYEVVKIEGDVDEYILSGVTNYNSLTLSDDLIVGGATTLTGAAGITDADVTTLDVTGITTVDEFTQGGSILATSTVGTAAVFKESDLLTYSGWEVTVNTSDATWTFPATSTLTSIIPNAGDFRTWVIHNATTTAAIDVIFAAGTGTELKGGGGAAATIDEASFGSFTLYRKANTDIMILTNFPAAD